MTPSALKASPDPVPSRWSVGIGFRLGLAFLAVTVLATVSNFMTRQVVEVSSQDVDMVVTARPLATTGDPPSAAIRPATPPALKVIANAVTSVITTVPAFDLTVLEPDSRGANDPQQQFNDASVKLRDTVKALTVARQAPRNAGSAKLLDLTRHLLAHELQARELVRAAAERQLNMDHYWQALAALQVHLNLALKDASKTPSPAPARAALQEMLAALNAIRTNASSWFARGQTRPELELDLDQAEHTFKELASNNYAHWARTPGTAWCDTLREQMTTMLAARAATDRLTQATASARHALIADTMVIQAQARQASRSTTTKSSADAPRSSLAPAPPLELLIPPPATTVSHPTARTTTAESTGAGSNLMLITAAVLLLVLLIGIGTVLSVTIPVRRLIAASARLARGDNRVRVPLSGARELKMLGASFNRMAERLESAETSVRTHQEGLEKTIHDRTRALKFLAEHDALTELPNRRQLFEHLETALQRAAAGTQQVGIFYLDCDNFKTVNDNLGHGFGDLLLQAIGKRLKSALTATTFAARLGGDEFILVAQLTEGAQEIDTIGKSLVESFRKPLLVRNRELLVTLSIGASIAPVHGQTTEALISAADAALFHAKENGRNQLCLFNPDLLEATRARFTVEQALRKAVEASEFELFYQPEISVDGSGVTTVEALLRWRQADGQYRGPGEFLNIAEQSGLIVEISDWVFETALKQLAQWYHHDWPEARVAINVSARQLMDVAFVNRLLETMQKYNIPPSRVEIELTETVLQTGPATIAALHRLRALGVTVALDDFGTGYSSLTSIEQLPLSRVKLDRSLIASIDSSSRALAIVESAISLCQRLGLQVTAEGVERVQQLDLLPQGSGMHIQGYLFARPLQARDVVPFVRTAQARMAEQLLLARTAAGPSTAESKTVKAESNITHWPHAVRPRRT